MTIPSTLGPGASGTAYTGPAPDGAVDAPIAPPDLAPLPEPELRGLQAAIAVETPPGTTDEITEPDGAPRLAEPTLQFADGDELALLLTSLDSRIRDTQARTAAQGLDLAGLQGSGAHNSMAARFAEASGKLADAAAKAKAAEVWAWVGRVSGFTGALAAQAAQLPAPEPGQTPTQPLLAAAVLGALSAGTETVLPATLPGGIDGLIDPALLHPTGLSTPDGQALDLSFSLLAADRAGAQAEQDALASGATPEQAARERLAVSVAAAVNTLVTVIAVVTRALGAQAPIDPGPPPTVPATAPATGQEARPDPIDAELQSQRERATRLMAATTQTASSAHASAASADIDAQAAQQRAQSTAQQVQATVRDLVRRQMQLQFQSNQLQNAGDEGAGISGLAVSQQAHKAEALRVSERQLQQHLAELQTQQTEQADKLRELVLSLQQLQLDLSQLMSTAADPRVQARHVVRA